MVPWYSLVNQPQHSLSRGQLAHDPCLIPRFTEDDPLSPEKASTTGFQNSLRCPRGCLYSLFSLQSSIFWILATARPKKINRYISQNAGPIVIKTSHFRSRSLNISAVGSGRLLLPHLLFWDSWPAWIFTIGGTTGGMTTSTLSLDASLAGLPLASLISPTSPQHWFWLPSVRLDGKLNPSLWKETEERSIRLVVWDHGDGTG